MKIQRDQLIEPMTTTLAGLFLGALKDGIEKKLIDEGWREKEMVEVKFTVEGHELNFMKVFEEWEKQLDRMVADKARDLINETFPGLDKLNDDLNDMAAEFKRNVRQKLKVSTIEE